MSFQWILYSVKLLIMSRKDTWSFSQRYVIHIKYHEYVLVLPLNFLQKLFWLFHSMKISSLWCVLLPWKFAYPFLSYLGINNSLGCISYTSLVSIPTKGHNFVTRHNSYAAIARIIHIDLRYRYGRSKSYCSSQLFELCRKQLSTTRTFYGCNIHVCL